jgi:N-acyl-phosphatidylethanolamine-hydrolysing phospholipase D
MPRGFPARPSARPAQRRLCRALRRSLAGGLGLLTLSLLAPAEAAPGTSALGPAPREADGRFSNSVGMLSRAGLSVELPFFLRRIAGSFVERSGAPDRVANDGAFLRENAKHSKPTVTWIGHATMLVQMDHVTFLTDPIWSDRPSPVSFAGPRRFVDPGVRLEDLPPIDFVLVSHNHYDHLDLPTLTALASRNPEARFFVPLENGALLRQSGIANVEELDWGESRSYAGVKVHCLPAQHWSKRGFGDDRKALWSSWAVTGSERRFFFAGDTGYFDGFAAIGRALGPFDLAAVPIGAYEPVAMMKESHMNPEEAVQAALDLRSRRALAMHYGTFGLSDEPLDEPPRRFRKAADASSLGASGGWLFRIGETRAF